MVCDASWVRVADGRGRQPVMTAVPPFYAPRDPHACRFSRGNPEINGSKSLVQERCGSGPQRSSRAARSAMQQQQGPSPGSVAMAGPPGMMAGPPGMPVWLPCPAPVQSRRPRNLFSLPALIPHARPSRGCCHFRRWGCRGCRRCPPYLPFLVLPQVSCPSGDEALLAEGPGQLGEQHGWYGWGALRFTAGHHQPSEGDQPALFASPHWHLQMAATRRAPINTTRFPLWRTNRCQKTEHSPPSSCPCATQRGIALGVDLLVLPTQVDAISKMTPRVAGYKPGDSVAKTSPVPSNR